MSLESAPDRSYDVPPADEREGKAKDEGDRYLGKITITHGSTLTRYPAGTRAAPRQDDVAGMNYFRRPGSHPTCERRVTRSSPCVGLDRPAHDNPRIPDSPAGLPRVMKRPSGGRLSEGLVSRRSRPTCRHRPKSAPVRRRSQPQSLIKSKVYACG
jgi:hypothetical protein